MWGHVVSSPVKVPLRMVVIHVLPLPGRVQAGVFLTFSKVAWGKMTTLKEFGTWTSLGMLENFLRDFGWGWSFYVCFLSRPRIQVFNDQGVHISPGTAAEGCLNCSTYHKLQLFLDSLFVTGIVCSIDLYWHILLYVVSWFVHVQRNAISLDSFCLRLFPFSQKSLKYSSSFTMILIARSFLLQLSILVHPDKNQDDADRAQKAFEGNALSLGCSGLVVAAFWCWFKCSLGWRRQNGCCRGALAVAETAMVAAAVWGGGISAGGTRWQQWHCHVTTGTDIFMGFWDCSRKTV